MPDAREPAERHRDDRKPCVCDAAETTLETEPLGLSRSKSDKLEKLRPESLGAPNGQLKSTLEARGVSKLLSFESKVEDLVRTGGTELTDARWFVCVSDSTVEDRPMPGHTELTDVHGSTLDANAERCLPVEDARGAL